MEHIEKAKYVCLTADGWTNQGRSYLGMTVHFFDKQLNKYSYLLAFRRMYGRHTHDVLKDLLLSVIKDFKIDLSKIRHIVTDGASNFEKAFKVFGVNNAEPHTEDIESQFDEIENDEIDIDELFESETDSIFTPTGTECVEIVLDDSTTSFDDDDDSDRLPEQLKCYSHSLNRTGVDFDKSIKRNLKKGHEILHSAYSKLNKFWTLNSRSSVAHEITERVCERSFPHPSNTRWNYKTDSIGIAEENKLKINEAIEEINNEAKKSAPNGKKGKKLEKLSSTEWKILRDYVTCMRPVSMGLDILQGDKRSSQGYILPVLYGIKTGIEENLTKQMYVSEYGPQFHDILLECLESRFGQKMKITEENKDLILAAAIHPNFKLLWLTNESDREFAQTLLINTCIDLSMSVHQIENECYQTESNDSQNEKKTKSNENVFFKHLRINQQSRRSSNDDSMTLEVYKYILQPSAEPSVHEFRGSYMLEDVFRRYNTTLSSSAPVERIFSQALIIFTNRRNRISDGNFEKALFVSQNKKILNIEC